jgi:hypothetical protein
LLTATLLWLVIALVSSPLMRDLRLGRWLVGLDTDPI